MFNSVKYRHVALIIPTPTRQTEWRRIRLTCKYRLAPHTAIAKEISNASDTFG